MTVKVDIPALESLVRSAVTRTETKALFMIEQKAKERAPVDTGFYRNNIFVNREQKFVIAEAVYSSVIEYGNGSGSRAPNPVMRTALRDTQKEVKSIFRKEFDRVRKSAI